MPESKKTKGRVVFLSTSQVGVKLGLSEATVRTLIRKGAFNEAYRFGKVYKVSQASVAAFKQKARVREGKGDE
jgi:excisionase family DNA binding protein